MFKIGKTFIPKQEKIRKNVNKEQCEFNIFPANVLGDKGVEIDLVFDSKKVGLVQLIDVDKDYVQLRFVSVEDEYKGGNAVILLYEKSIEYAESLSKKLLFDSHLTAAAYKSFKKLENFGYKVIENPEMKFDGTDYSNPGSWTLRVERREDSDK